MQHKINTINTIDHHKIVLTRFAVSAVALMVVASMLTVVGRFVSAESRYNDQIRSIQNEANRSVQQAESLSRMADSYEAELRQLEHQSEQIKQSLRSTQKQHADLSKEITTIEKRLTKSQDMLGDLIIDIQIDSEITPLEIIASSATIGQYVDRQSQQAIIRQDLDKEIVTISKIKKDLKIRQQEVAKLVAVQKNQQEQIRQKAEKQQKLITETRGEEQRYRQFAEANNQRVTQLREEQAEQNRLAAESAISGASSGSVHIPPGILGGDYPFVDGPLDYGVDPWGLYYRECVSYAAWKVASTGRFVPHFGGKGNANEWPSTVAKFGIKNSNEPRKGSVAMQDIGVYGHVMYVEEVHDDNTITVSDYNLAWDGLYRKYTRSSGGLTYIHF